MSELQTGAVIGIYALIILSIIVTMLVLAKLFGGYHPDAEKETPFEYCKNW